MRVEEGAQPSAAPQAKSLFSMRKMLRNIRRLLPLLEALCRVCAANSYSGFFARLGSRNEPESRPKGAHIKRHIAMLTRIPIKVVAKRDRRLVSRIRPRHPVTVEAKGDTRRDKWLRLAMKSILTPLVKNNISHTGAFMAVGATPTFMPHPLRAFGLRRTTDLQQCARKTAE